MISASKRRWAVLFLIVFFVIAIVWVSYEPKLQSQPIELEKKFSEDKGTEKQDAPFFPIIFPVKFSTENIEGKWLMNFRGLRANVFARSMGTYNELPKNLNRIHLVLGTERCEVYVWPEVPPTEEARSLSHTSETGQMFLYVGGKKPTRCNAFLIGVAPILWRKVQNGSIPIPNDEVFSKVLLEITFPEEYANLYENDDLLWEASLYQMWIFIFGGIFVTGLFLYAKRRWKQRKERLLSQAEEVTFARNTQPKEDLGDLDFETT
ncbi:hypothetical protein ACFL13_03180 [Patescibacteria group bacterium]